MQSLDDAFLSTSVYVDVYSCVVSKESTVNAILLRYGYVEIRHKTNGVLRLTRLLNWEPLMVTS